MRSALIIDGTKLQKNGEILDATKKEHHQKIAEYLSQDDALRELVRAGQKDKVYGILDEIKVSPKALETALLPEYAASQLASAVGAAKVGLLMIFLPNEAYANVLAASDGSLMETILAEPVYPNKSGEALVNKIEGFDRDLQMMVLKKPLARVHLPMHPELQERVGAIMAGWENAPVRHVPARSIVESLHA